MYVRPGTDYSRCRLDIVSVAPALFCSCCVERSSASDEPGVRSPSSVFACVRFFFAARISSWDHHPCFTREPFSCGVAVRVVSSACRVRPLLPCIWHIQQTFSLFGPIGFLCCPTPFGAVPHAVRVIAVKHKQKAFFFFLIKVCYPSRELYSEKRRSFRSMLLLSFAVDARLLGPIFICLSCATPVRVCRVR